MSSCINDELDVLNYEFVVKEKYEIVIEKKYRMEEQMVALSTSFLPGDAVWNALYEFKNKNQFHCPQ